MPIPFTLSPESIREQFNALPLDITTVRNNPIEQFTVWYSEIQQTRYFLFPNSFILSTAGESGIPSARVLLMKDMEARGLTFFSHYESPKAKELESNPQACATFYWPVVERQVRICGNVIRLTPEESESFFHTRTRENQIIAWASQQSDVISGKSILEEKYEGFEKLFRGREVPRPSRWGGYLLIPDRMEFFQLRAVGFHDRILYKKTEDGHWQIQRLAP